MTNFIATKRVGAVLAANLPLSWFEAGQVLALLNGEAGVEIDKVLETKVRDFFDPKAKLVRGKAAGADALSVSRSRGQVYHSRRVRASCGGFDVLVSISFTVCVMLDVTFLDQKARPSQSKFWCSAIIIGDGPLSDNSHEERFAGVCEKVEDFAPRILEGVLHLYGDAVREVKPEIDEIAKTGDHFSTVMLQVEDAKFRQEVALLQRGEKTLSQSAPTSALGTLNRLYSGGRADKYLHLGRTVQGDADANLDAIVHTDALRAHAFLIETRAKRKTADWRLLGVTSTTEPVPWKPRRSSTDVERFVHSPANVLSAEVAAEIGEQF